MHDALIVLALALPLVAYVWAAASTPQAKVTSLAGYFTAYKQVGAAPFSNSSLAYAFQVATLFPFLYWGATGQLLPAIVNAICWGFGILLFRSATKLIVQHLTATPEPKTLHGLLGDAFASSAVQKVSAGITILGMIGVALGEAYWGMQVVKVLVVEDSVQYYVVVFGSLIFVLGYIWYGGAWGSMKTDMLQLVFSYLGFTIVFIFAAAVMAQSATLRRPDLAIVGLLMFVGGLGAVIVRLTKRLPPVSSMGDNAEGSAWVRLRTALSYATLTAIVLLALAFALLFVQSRGAFSVEPLLNPGDPQWKGVVALALTAMAFQFVDMTAWQRIQAIAGGSDQVQRRARDGLLLFAIESPYSWIMCLALGTSLVTVLPQLATVDDKAGPLAAFPRLLFESGGMLNVAVALSFITAVMAVMLSTIDSALLGAMYAWAADFARVDFGTVSPNKKAIPTYAMEKAALSSAKRTGAYVLLSIMLLILVLGGTLHRPQDFISVLVGFYGALLSLLPAVLFMLFAPTTWPRPSPLSCVLGMLGGVAGALSFAIWGIFAPDMSWNAVFAAPAISVSVSAVIYAFERYATQRSLDR